MLSNIELPMYGTGISDVCGSDLFRFSYSEVSTLQIIVLTVVRLCLF